MMFQPGQIVLVRKSLLKDWRLDENENIGVVLEVDVVDVHQMMCVRLVTQPKHPSNDEKDCDGWYVYPEDIILTLDIEDVPDSFLIELAKWRLTSV